MYFEKKWLGITRYSVGLELQDFYIKQVTATNGFIIGLEHEPVMTLGARFKSTDGWVLPSSEYELVATDRGGEATLHMPGQLVVYPIFRLDRISVRDYVSILEQSIIETLVYFGVESHTSDQPGVFVKNSKIASIGIRVSRGVTKHGLALNVNNDLSVFKNTVACGIQAPKVTNLTLCTRTEPFYASRQVFDILAEILIKRLQ